MRLNVEEAQKFINEQAKTSPNTNKGANKAENCNGSAASNYGANAGINSPTSSTTSGTNSSAATSPDHSDAIFDAKIDATSDKSAINSDAQSIFTASPALPAKSTSSADSPADHSAANPSSPSDATTDAHHDAKHDAVIDPAMRNGENDDQTRVAEKDIFAVLNFDGKRPGDDSIQGYGESGDADVESNGYSDENDVINATKKGKDETVTVYQRKWQCLSNLEAKQVDICDADVARPVKVPETEIKAKMEQASIIMESIIRLLYARAVSSHHGQRIPCVCASPFTLDGAKKNAASVACPPPGDCRSFLCVRGIMFHVKEIMPIDIKNLFFMQFRDAVEIVMKIQVENLDSAIKTTKEDVSELQSGKDIQKKADVFEDDATIFKIKSDADIKDLQAKFAILMNNIQNSIQAVDTSNIDNAEVLVNGISRSPPSKAQSEINASKLSPDLEQYLVEQIALGHVIPEANFSNTTRAKPLFCAHHMKENLVGFSKNAQKANVLLDPHLYFERMVNEKERERENDDKELAKTIAKRHRQLAQHSKQQAKLNGSEITPLASFLEGLLEKDPEMTDKDKLKSIKDTMAFIEIMRTQDGTLDETLRQQVGKAALSDLKNTMKPKYEEQLAIARPYNRNFDYRKIKKPVKVQRGQEPEPDEPDDFKVAYHTLRRSTRGYVRELELIDAYKCQRTTRSIRNILFGKN